MGTTNKKQGITAKSASLVMLLLLFIMEISSCNSPQQELANPAGSPEENQLKQTLNNTPLPSRLLDLNPDTAADAATADLHQNLFGKFFADRAAFYIVRNPTNKLYHSNIKTMTMYYLDGRRSKTKYIMAENVENRLVTAFGSFTIKGYDDKNRALIRNKKIWASTVGSLALNTQLDNYEISWTFGHTHISYRVEAMNKEETYKYSESLLSYEQSLRRIRIEED
jgi:hypothetical protein